MITTSAENQRSVPDASIGHKRQMQIVGIGILLAGLVDLLACPLMSWWICRMPSPTGYSPTPTRPYKAPPLTSPVRKDKIVAPPRGIPPTSGPAAGSRYTAETSQDHGPVNPQAFFPPAVWAVASTSETTSGTSTGRPYAVRIASRVLQHVARNFVRQLQMDGYGPVRVIETTGTYTVLVGSFLSEKEAASLMTDLRSSGGYPVDKVVSIPEDTGATKPRTDGEIYRVRMKRPLPDRKLAEEAARDLRASDYVDVDIVEDGGQFYIYVGRFTSEEEAEKVERMLDKDSYPFWEIVRIGYAVDIRVPDRTQVEEAAKELQACGFDNVHGLIEDGHFYVHVGGFTSEEEADRFKQRLLGNGDLKNKIGKPEPETTESLKIKEDGRQLEPTSNKQMSVGGLWPEVDRAIEAANFERARQLCRRMRQIGPNEPKVEFKLQLIDRLEVVWLERNREELRFRRAIQEAQNALARRRFQLAREKAELAMAIKPHEEIASRMLEDIRYAQAFPLASAPAGSLAWMWGCVALFFVFGVVQLLGARHILLRQSLRGARWTCVIALLPVHPGAVIGILSGAIGLWTLRAPECTGLSWLNVG